MKIHFHFTYLIIAFGFVITGYFPNLIIFTSIIIIHEFGHYLIAKIIGLNPLEITIYPFGGITKMDNLINTRIEKELIVAISGVLFQSLYYFIILILYKHTFIRDYIFNIYKMYHYNILYFNLLPIYPLDGMIILNLILSKFIPYKVTMKINIFISIITTIIILKTNYYNVNYTTILISTIIIDNLVKYYKNINYLFNRFLLERYLHRLYFSKTKAVNKIDNLYKDKYHIIKEKNTYITEKQALFRRFTGKY